MYACLAALAIATNRVTMLCDRLPHAAGANTSDAARVGIGCSYAPWYLGRLTMDLVPITPAAHARLTPAAQALTKHMLTWQVRTPWVSL